MTAKEKSLLIKKASASFGFSFCGISKACFLEEEAPRLEQWLKAGMNGKMKYMENYFDKRLDPTLLVDGAKSVITLGYNYFTSKRQTDTLAPKVSKYAYGQDYHQVLKEKLKLFSAHLKTLIGNFEARVFVDSAPVLEKAWAKKSGVGWIGKNSNLITKKQGSYFFLCEIILDLELEPDGPIKDYCGSCTACIDACPTDAIVDARVVDGSKCISYFTIELKDSLPQEMKGKFENWAFGCDICQDVCPWNRFSKASEEQAFQPSAKFMDLTATEWEALTEETFKMVFGKSPLTRVGFKGLKRNLEFLKNTQ